MPAAKQEDLSIPTTNPSYVLRGIEDTAFEDRDIPTECGPHDVIVAPKKTGLCGSDVHYLSHGKCGAFVVEKPMVLGHETAAVVVKVGSSVKTLKKGDRVALEPGESCRKCDVCKEGFYNRCPDMVFAATPPYDGTLAGFYRLPSDLAYKLPETVSLEEGALMEPLSVAVMAVARVARMPLGANVVVFGAGPVGLLTMAVAKALGARKVIAVDIQQARLEFAASYAANDYFIPPPTKEGESRLEYSSRSAQEIRSRFGFGERGSTGVDLVVDCTGAEVCIQTGVYVVKHGGTCVQVGMGNDSINIPMSTLLVKEVTLKGSFRYGPGCYDMSIDLVARGLINLDRLITHRFSFRDANAAFKANQAGKGTDGKPLIKAIVEGPIDSK
ncbi:BQ5605_C002g01731 [Microbotryum silenes-dioicae]|uniref:BQ5605_C002g01731 protein n=1 Tax=Microbotryum silenes-dioicae TaxID=796604 RepID=A0A2X0M3P0_9BASI|nr:BQ5605_C002g01731 [Microbotryum silenes-dioicae]